MTQQVSITRGGFQLNRTTGRYVQFVTLRNTGSAGIPGRVALVLDALAGNAPLFNRTGFTSCTSPAGSPFLNFIPGSDNVLSPGEVISLALEFENPSAQSITYSTRVLAGTDPR